MEQNVIVAKIATDHPSGQYVSQGYKFLPEWQVVEDEPKVLAALEADSHLIVAPAYSRHWFNAQGMAFNAESLAKYGLDESGQPLGGKKGKKGPEFVKKPASKEETPKQEKTQEGASEKAEQGVMTKAEIVKKLEEAGKVDGKDFNKDAKVADLKALLDTLTA